MADFDYTAFLAVADALLQPQDATPAAVRTAAGRYYYACYGSIRRRIEEACGDCFDESGLHTTLWESCLSLASEDLQWLGERLRALCNLRMKADYKWRGDELTRKQVMYYAEIARRTCERIKVISPDDLKLIGADVARRRRRIRGGG